MWICEFCDEINIKFILLQILIRKYGINNILIIIFCCYFPFFTDPMEGLIIMDEILFDKPVENLSEDFLSRKDFSVKIADALIYTNKDPLVIGLYGSWGSGKHQL